MATQITDLPAGGHVFRTLSCTATNRLVDGKQHAFPNTVKVRLGDTDREAKNVSTGLSLSHVDSSIQ